MGITVKLDVSSYSVHWHNYIAIFVRFPAIEKKPRVRAYLAQLRHVLEQWNDMYCNCNRNITCVLNPEDNVICSPNPRRHVYQPRAPKRARNMNIAKPRRGVLCFWVIVS